MKWILLFIAAGVCIPASFAQDVDSLSVDSQKDTVVDEPLPPVSFRYRLWDENRYTTIDSAFSVTDHLRVNEWNRDMYGQLSMANLSTPLVFLVYQPDVNAGLRSGFQSYFAGWRNARNIPLYDVKAPLSEIRYMSSYERGQMFGGFITINPNERSNIFLDYQRVSARGDYFSQDNLHDRIRASGHFRTKNNRYIVQSVLQWNKNRGRESGGIVDIEAFSDEDSLQTSRELIDIRWQDSRFKARQFHALISQQYLPFADSTAPTGIGLYHEGDILFSDRTFTSTDSLIGNFYIDSLLTSDSTYFASTDQQAGLVFQSGIQSFTYAKAGLGYQYSQLSNAYFFESEYTLYLNAELRGDARYFDWKATGRYYFTGSQSGAFKLNGSIGGSFGSLRLGGHAIFLKQFPDMQSQHWYSNEFIWNNQWESVLYQGLGGFAAFRDWVKLSFNLHNWNQPIYYGHNALPAQGPGSVQLIRSELRFNLPLTSWLTVTSNTTMQITSGSEDVLRLPKWVNRSGIYGKWHFFKRALTAYIGAEGQYYSSYYANAYMPVTGVFHLQDQQEIGDFPYFNAVAGFQIRSFELYFVWENAAEGFVDRRYFAAPYYPMADRTLRFGFKWRFFN